MKKFFALILLVGGAVCITGGVFAFDGGVSRASKKVTEKQSSHWDSLRLELGSGMRLESGEGGVGYEGQSLLGLGIDFSLTNRLSNSIELSFFKATSRSSALSVSRTHFEIMNWLNFEILRSQRFLWQLSGGAGFFNESVKTSFINSEFVGASGLSLLFGGGTSLLFSLNRDWKLKTSIRFISLTNNDLSLVTDFLLRLGYAF